MTRCISNSSSSRRTAAVSEMVEASTGGGGGGDRVQRSAPMRYGVVPLTDAEATTVFSAEARHHRIDCRIGQPVNENTYFYSACVQRPAPSRSIAVKIWTERGDFTPECRRPAAELVTHCRRTVGRSDIRGTPSWRVEAATVAQMAKKKLMRQLHGREWDVNRSMA